MSVFAALSELSALFPGKPVFALDIAGAPLRVLGFSGHEALCELFEFRVEVVGADLDPDDLIDRPALLTIKGLDEPRHVHGVVVQAEYIGHSRELELYELTIAPRASRLLHRASSRIFQSKTTEAIVREVLDKAGLTSDEYRFTLHSSYAPRDYCVQYRETDLAFVSRLLEEDGIFWFFAHTEDRHVWVMGDHASVHPAIAGDPALWFAPPAGHAVQDREHVHAFRFGGRVRPGKVTVRDHNLHTPSTLLDAHAVAAQHADLEVYEFPAEFQQLGSGGPDRGDQLAKIRLEALRANQRFGTAASDSPRLTPGHVMSLTAHPRPDLNTDYRIVRVDHVGAQPQVLDKDATGDNSYRNSFTVTELRAAYRPPRVTPRPSVRGMQTATVVGPAGEEIHTDEHGRVRVQFHWDRDGQFDENSATWVRVSQVWAGNGWGAMFIPRIGHEVLVDFLEGDPDRPIVVGRIYHGQNATPYPLPAEKTRSTIKSDSSLGGGGYNELRYEDSKGREQIYLHAERNLDVRVNHDAFDTVWNDSHVTVGNDQSGDDGRPGKAGDSFVQLFHDHHLKIHRHTAAHLGGDVALLVGGVDGPGRVDVHVRSDKLELVDGDRHEHTRKSTFEKVDGSVSRIVEGNEQAKVAGRAALETGDEIHFKSAKIVLDAGQELTIQAPGGHITINSSGIYLSGTMIYLNSGGSPATAAPAAPGTAQDARDAAPTAATPSELGSRK